MLSGSPLRGVRCIGSGHLGGPLVNVGGGQVIGDAEPAAFVDDPPEGVVADESGDGLGERDGFAGFPLASKRVPGGGAVQPIMTLCPGPSAPAVTDSGWPVL